MQFLPLTWTIVHPVDQDSPLWGKGPEDLVRRQAEFLITIKAFDDTFFQTVHVRHSYRYDEVVWGRALPPPSSPTPRAKWCSTSESSAPSHLSKIPGKA